MAEQNMLVRTIHDIPRCKNFLVMNGFTEVDHKDLKYQDTILADLNNKTFFIVDGDGMYTLLVKGELVKYESFITKTDFINYVCDVLHIEPTTSEPIVLATEEPKNKRTTKKQNND